MEPMHGEQLHAQMHLGQPRRRPLQRGGRRWSSPTHLVAGLVLGLSVSVSACKDLTGSQPLPSGTVDPTFYRTPAGAVGLRTQALYTLEGALPSYLTNSGLLTDELESTWTGIPSDLASQVPLSGGVAVDARLLPEGGPSGISSGLGGAATDGDYTRLQVVRNNINQALAAIAAYDTGAKAVGDPRHLRAELFALQGYTELLLADLFCSGVPLSTLDFNGDYTYHAGSTTAEVYHDAIVQADSALALADTSTQLQYLARVLKGRALLDLDSAAAAAQVVASVPDGFQYQLAVNFQSGASNYMTSGEGTIADTEGQHGLPYLSSNDPRVQDTVLSPAGEAACLGAFCNPSYTRPIPLTFPKKYSTSGFAPFVVASGMEARLIQAEAALNVGDASWLTTLNQLRATTTVPGQTGQPPATLTDPGTDSARVTLLFRERAFWLFLTGERQGDLRRLLRQYGNVGFRRQDQVYPSGPYLGGSTLSYGRDVTAPIPSNEYLNPLFHGCHDRNP